MPSQEIAHGTLHEAACARVSIQENYGMSKPVSALERVSEFKASTFPEAVEHHTGQEGGEIYRFDAFDGSS